MRRLPLRSEKKQVRRYRKYDEYRQEGRKSKSGGTRGEKVPPRRKKKQVKR